MRAPELRRRIQPAPPLCGPPLWVDDPGFSIDRHVRTAAIAPPGDEASLLATTELLLREPLDRSHPLWRLWVLTGLEGNRLGLLFVVHHVLADGLAAVALISTFLDVDPAAADPPVSLWHPEPAPTPAALFTDAARTRLDAVGARLAHPLRLAHRTAVAVTSVPGPATWRAGAQRTSLNAPVGAGRRIRVVHLDLEVARTLGHAHGGTVNDVVLSVVSGGVRDLLLARGEPVDGVELAVAVPAGMRDAHAARQLGNVAGALSVRLPAGEPDGARRIELIAARTRTAKAEQTPTTGHGVFGVMTATGLFPVFVGHQRMFHFFVSNVPGPPVPLFVLGARIERVMPILATLGNLSMVFATLSYCGRLDLVVNADAAACPDVDVLTAGMQRAWDGMVASEPGAVTAA